MPTKDYKEKLDNVRMLDEPLSKAVSKMTESLDEYIGDDAVDNLLVSLGATGDITLLDCERENIEHLLKSTIADLKDTLFKKLRIGLKKDGSLLNAIISQIEPPTTSSEKAKRDEQIRLEKDGNYRWLKSKITPNPASKINLDALAFLNVSNNEYIREAFMENKSRLTFGKMTVWSVMVGGDEPGTYMAPVSISKESIERCNKFLFGTLIPLVKSAFDDNLKNEGALFLHGYEFIGETSYAPIINYKIDDKIIS